MQGIALKACGMMVKMHLMIAFWVFIKCSQSALMRLWVHEDMGKL